MCFYWQKHVSAYSTQLFRRHNARSTINLPGRKYFSALQFLEEDAVGNDQYDLAELVVKIGPGILVLVLHEE